MQQDDLQQIKQIIEENNKNLATQESLDDLASAVKFGFEQVDKRFEQVDKRFELIDKKIEQIDVEIRHINARLNTIEHDIATIIKHFVYRDEFEDVLMRLSAVEKKLGLRSGK